MNPVLKNRYILTLKNKIKKLQERIKELERRKPHRVRIKRLKK
jgi:hypothetical protein